MPSIDKDLKEKISFQKILWQKGYLSLLDVPVITIREDLGDLKKDEITDADVLGIRFDETLSRQIDVADCKSGTESHSRLLWLKGLQSYLRASDGHYVSRNITKRFPELSKRLNLHLWKIDEIEGILKDHGWREFNYLFKESSYSEYKEFQHKVLGKKKIIFSNFLKYDYWRLLPNRRLQSLLFNFSQVQKELGTSVEDNILVHRTLLKAALSILDLGSFIMAQDRKNIHSLTESYIFGSSDEVNLKKQSIKARGGTESDFYPEYYQALLDILVTVTRRSDCSKDICRFLQEYIFETNLLRKPLSLEQFSNSYKDKRITAKIAKDVAIFFSNSTGFDSKRFENLISL